MTLPKSLLVLIVVVCAFRYCRSIEVSLRGLEYISYDLRSRPILTKRNDISFSFKTFYPSGLLIHSGGSMGDFMTIELVHGKLRIKINVGSYKAGKGSHSDLLFGDNLADYEWHKVTITRSWLRLTVKLDRTKTISQIGQDYTVLHLDQNIFVGGVNRTLSSDYHGAERSPQFIGCIRDVTFDFRDILYEVINKVSEKHRVGGTPKFSCSREEYKPIGFPTPNSHLYLSRFLSPHSFSLDLKFRSYDENGALAFKITNNGKVYISLVSGALALEVSIGTNRPLLITVGKGLGDGNWHNVSAGVNRNEMWLVLDNQPEVQHQNPQLDQIGRFRRHLLIGRAMKRVGFVGCMRDVRVDNRTVNPDKLTSREIVETTNRCNLTSRCFPNPCRNGRKCFQTWTDFSCDCQGSFYVGKKCEKPLLRSTCHEYRKLGVTKDSYCKIDPDGEGPLNGEEILCNMTASRSAVTVISHNLKERKKVVDGAKPLFGFYFQTVEYKSDLATIRALITKSKKCRQYISYECFQSPLLSSPSGPADVAWTSATGVQMPNWGGAPSGSNKCACGVNGTCADSSKYCNCDIGDAKWREDSGYLSDKQYLPVTSLRFASHASKSFFTLGPLECFGTSSNLKELRSLSTASFVSAACRLVNPPPTTPGPSTPRSPTRPWFSRITLSPNLKTTAVVPVVTSNPTTVTTMNGGGHGHVTVTVTTMISTHDNSTVVTSVVKHKLSNVSQEGVTIHSSIHTGKGGVTVHSTVSSKEDAFTSPPVMSPGLVTTPRPPEERIIFRNGNVSEVFIHHKSSARFTVLVVTTVLAFILVVLIIILFLKRSGHGYYFCFSCRRCGNKRQIPDIEVYRHSEIRCDSPDVIGFDDVRNSTVECGSYNVQNGHVYHSSTLRKYVTFSASTSKL